MKLSEKLKETVNKISEKTGLGKKLILIILLFALGIAALLMSELGAHSGAGDNEPSETAAAIGTDDYIAKLEERITSIISSIDGAGATQVMITLESGSEEVYLHNYNYGEDVDEVGAGNREVQDEYVIVDSGNGEKGIIIRVEEPRIRGVAVVCEGGGNDVVRADIIATITALLDISSARVSVSKMN